jgi:hypothetical protein
MEISLRKHDQSMGNCVEMWLDKKGSDLMLTDWVGKPSKVCLFRFFSSSLHSILSFRYTARPFMKWGSYGLLSGKVGQKISLPPPLGQKERLGKIVFLVSITHLGEKRWACLGEKKEQVKGKKWCVCVCVYEREREKERERERERALSEA